MLVVIKLRRDHKKGTSPCGCGCDNCPSSGMCHKKKRHILSAENRPVPWHRAVFPFVLPIWFGKSC
ncbi:MAG: hypothetical protein KHX46_08840 [Clostridiales bacterium]|nr:hypothetical protein [Clostridiales bacterium]